MSGRPNLKDYSLERLRERFAGEGLPAYRADQIAGWVYQRGVEDFAEMSDLDRALRERLQAEWQVRCLEVERLDRSTDGPLKAILRADDGAQVESVLIPEADRTTLCVSTQVGCAMACTFCATGALGFTRNLTAAEIIEQVCRMRELLDEPRKITNIVFMGMGEPLLNLAAVSEAIAILVNPKTFALAPRRVTVSTVGVLPRIEALLEVAPINLAVSLHATTDRVRDQLVPLNRRYNLARLMHAVDGYLTKTGRQVTFEAQQAVGEGRLSVNPRRPVFFEYTLIEGINDSLEDARRLPALLRGIPSKLNLIPMNPHPESPYRPPSDAAIDAFLRVLAGAGMTVTLRRSRGDDIGAACGQLALRRAGAAAA